jgi:hypothetical protein
VAKRVVLRIETDILNGSLPPDSRLGVIDNTARYGVRPTPLRDALSWLAPRGIKRDQQTGLSHKVGVAAGPRGNRAHSCRRRAAEHARGAGRCLDKVKTVLGNRLPSRCEKVGQGNHVPRTFALKPYGK